MAVIRPYLRKTPRFGGRVWLAPNCTIVGDVELGDDCNVWYGSVIRGDVGRARLGARVNVQDLCCIHMTTNLSEAIIDDDASLGHGVIVHGAIVGSGALIGMGSVLLDNARIGEEALIGAGSLVTGGTVIPPRTLAVGRPARVVRELRADEHFSGRETAAKYLRLAEEHRRADP